MNINNKKNRRDFLKYSALGLAGVTTASVLSSCASFDDYLFDDKNNLTNVTVHTCDYQADVYLSYYTPHMKIVCDDLFLKMHVIFDNLLKERQLIRSAREEANDKHGLGPILYAGMILEGGIVSYDTNIRTGGIGVRWLGIGPDTQYQEDVVTVSIRAISVQTGEVLLSVNTQKTLLSYTAGVAIFKFYDNGTKNFESEIGMTQTEASIHCIKLATDLAVEQLIIQGEKKGLWQFKEKSNEK